MIEQRGVRRRIAKTAEVVDGANQAVAEQVPPDAVHGDARRQRIAGRRDRLGEPEAHLSRIVVRTPVEGGQERPRHQVAPVRVAAPDEQGLIGRRFVDDARRAARHRHVALQQSVLRDRRPQLDQIFERAGQQVGAHELVQEDRLLVGQRVIAPGGDRFRQPPANQRREFLARRRRSVVRRVAAEQGTDRNDGLPRGRLRVVEQDAAGADGRAAVGAPGGPEALAAVLGVEDEHRGVILRRELDVGGEVLPEAGVPLRPAHRVLLRAVAQVVDAAAGNRVVLDDQLREAEVAAQHAEADEVAVDPEARRLDDAGVLVRQQVGVGAAGVDAGQQVVATPRDDELARAGGPGRAADAVADGRRVGLRIAQVPREVEMLAVESLARCQLRFPTGLDGLPRAREVGGIHVREGAPDGEHAARVALGRCLRGGSLILGGRRFGVTVRCCACRLRGRGVRRRTEHGQQLPAGLRRVAAPALGQRRSNLRLEVGQRVAVGREHGRVVNRALRRARAIQGAEERVVVPLADGVELVIVTARARHRQAEERLGGDVHLVVGPLDPVLPGIDGLVAMLDQPVVGGPEKRFVRPRIRVDARIGQQVAREVFADQPIVRHVGIERADQVVAVAPGQRDVRVAFAAVGLAVAEQVHPVARPPFAEVGRVQIAVDQIRPRRRRPVGGEARDLGRCRRQAAQVERQPPDERRAVGVAGRRESFGFKPGQEVAILHGRRPGRGADRRRLRRDDRLPGPVRGAARFQIERLRWIGSVGRGAGHRPGSAHFHPPGDGLDLAGLERAGRRHQDRPAVHPLHDGAVRRAAGHERRSRVSAFQHRLAAVEPETAEGRGDAGAVAGVTVVGEERADGGLEELRLLRRGRLDGRRLGHGQRGRPRERHRHGQYLLQEHLGPVESCQRGNVLPGRDGSKPPQTQKKRAFHAPLHGTPARKGSPDKEGPSAQPKLVLRLLTTPIAETFHPSLAPLLEPLTATLLQLAHLFTLLRRQNLQHVGAEPGPPDQRVRLERGDGGGQLPDPAFFHRLAAHRVPQFPPRFAHGLARLGGRFPRLIADPIDPFLLRITQIEPPEREQLGPARTSAGAGAEAAPLRLDGRRRLFLRRRRLADSREPALRQDHREPQGNDRAQNPLSCNVLSHRVLLPCRRASCAYRLAAGCDSSR